MKKNLFISLLTFSLVILIPNQFKAQTGFNTILEYCTGTWCQWCPCGHTIINNILAQYPNTMVLGYHGAGNDPWQSYSAGIRAIFGFNAYPTGVVGRRTGIVSRSVWHSWVAYQITNIEPGVSIQVNNKNYNPSTRTITADVVLTALTNLSGSYYINFVLTENNLVYPQTGNGSCPGGENYIHKNVVKGMINGDLGTLLNTSDNWTQGHSVTVNLNYAIPSGFVESNCVINIFVYKSGGYIGSDSHIQQTRMEGVTTPVGIVNNNETPLSYSLGQNYPNPFNPVTNIKFSVPKSGNATLIIYDMMGREVAKYLDGYVDAGTYNAEVDASGWASGVYFYTLRTSEFTETKKMMLTK